WGSGVQGIPWNRTRNVRVWSCSPVIGPKPPGGLIESMNAAIEAEGTSLTFLHLSPLGIVTVIDSSRMSVGLSVRSLVAGLMVIAAGAAPGRSLGPWPTAVSFAAAAFLAMSLPPGQG